MNQIHQAIKHTHELDFLANRNLTMNRLHPLSKLLSILVYIIFVLSFFKYDVTGILSMAIYVIVLFQISDLSMVNCLYQSRYILFLLSMIGIINLYFDQTIILYVENIPISGGCLSFFVLLFKQIFCLEAVYFLIATTTMEEICCALQQLHIPKILVTTILLIYRYIVLLLQEVNHISVAYHLRAPFHKGIQYQSWGSLVGQLLLRSMDRSLRVYDSMLLRGFNGKFNYDVNDSKRIGSAFLFVCTIFYCILCRIFPLFEWVGRMF